MLQLHDVAVERLNDVLETTRVLLLLLLLLLLLCVVVLFLRRKFAHKYFAKIFSFFRLIRDFFFLESVTSDALW